MVCIVTGAGRGIGRAIALRVARLGYSVVCAARSVGEIERVAEEIRREGGRAEAIPADLADPDAIAALFAETERRLGHPDVLVNNAGVGAFGEVVDFPAADLDRLYNVNLRGTFLCCQQAMRRMVPRGSGYIVNISSVVGFRGYPNQSGYSATKHAVMGLTKALAAEAQPHGVRVSAVLPGGVDTEMVRSARPDLDPEELLAPEDVAGAVAYLLSLSERAAVDEIYIRRRNSKAF